MFLKVQVQCYKFFCFMPRFFPTDLAILLPKFLQKVVEKKRYL
jgi:hypothetical protein